MGFLMNTQTIYIGPSLSGSRLPHATVFRGEYPVYIQKIMEKHPWFKSLFVPVEDFAKSLKTIQKPGTALYIFAKRSKEV